MIAPPNRSSKSLIVYQAPWDWDWLRTRAQPLAESLAQVATVLYVDCGEAKGSPRAARFAQRFRLQSLAKQLFTTFTVTPLADGLHRCAWRGLTANKWSGIYADRGRLPTYRFARWLRKFAAAFDRVWLLTSRPKLTRLLNAYPWDCVIVDIEDPWVQLHWSHVLQSGEVERFLSRADLVTANGRAAAEVMQPYCPTPIANLANGVDQRLVEQLAKPLARPEFFRPSPRPRAVYTGGIDNRLDYGVLDAVAARRGEVDFYFVGPKGKACDGAKEQQAKLFERPNVFHVPSRPHEEIPNILAHADYLLNPLSHQGGAQMFPGKLLEYVAAAKPILSIPDYSTSGVELPSIFVCRDAYVMSESLRRFVASEIVFSAAQREQCRAVARDATWSSRAARLVEMASTVSSQKGPVAAQ